MTQGAPRPIAPPATIGILGGGQLGRMTALAARSMGYRVHVLDPDPNCATAPVADRVVTAKFDDVEAARDFARQCDVVTLEIEQIATSVLDAARTFAPTRPGSTAIGIIQDRVKQKRWLTEQKFPVGPWRAVASEGDVTAAIAAFNDAFVKSARGGFDGRGQLRATSAARAAEAWRVVGAHEAVAEQALDLAHEISVMVARRPSGETRAFPVSLNHHERHALAWSAIPAPVAPQVAARATELGIAIVERMGLEGLLAIEMFVTKAGDLLVNELAPRPHNSFHSTERGCVTSQFEQLVRAVCDLPLGDTSIARPAAIVNLFGDIWHMNGAPPFDAALSDPSVRLHLYGKGEPRPARKMGHLSAVGDTAMTALAAVRDAGAKVGAKTDAPDASFNGAGR